MILCGNDYYRIQYRSEDGITYTRTDEYDEEIDLGCECKLEEYYKEEWKDAIGYFLQVNTSVFEGLYKYGLYEDQNLLSFIKVDTLDIIRDYETTVNNDMFNISSVDKTIYSYIDANKVKIILDKLYSDISVGGYYQLYIKNDILYMGISYSYSFDRLFIDNNTNKFIGFSANFYGRRSDAYMDIYKINLDEGTYEYIEQIYPTLVLDDGTETHYGDFLAYILEYDYIRTIL